MTVANDHPMYFIIEVLQTSTETPFKVPGGNCFKHSMEVYRGDQTCFGSEGHLHQCIWTAQLWKKHIPECSHWREVSRVSTLDSRRLLLSRVYNRREGEYPTPV